MNRIPNEILNAEIEMLDPDLGVVLTVGSTRLRAYMLDLRDARERIRELEIALRATLEALGILTDEMSDPGYLVNRTIFEARALLPEATS